MSPRSDERPGIHVQIPGRRVPLRLRRAVFDFNGTLATDGRLARGVAPRLVRLARLLELDVLTADTFGTARRALGKLPVAVQIVRDGAEKRRYVEAVGARGVVAVGNGANDVPMLRAARLGIAVCGAEGLARELLRAATILVRQPDEALDLLLDPRRLVATLRR